MAMLAALIIFTVSLRLVVGYEFPELANFMPLMAIAFVSSAFIRNKWAWILPFLSLIFSDFILSFRPGESAGLNFWSFFAAIFYIFASFLGKKFIAQRSWSHLIFGSFLCTLTFFLASNTFAFLANPAYQKTIMGWLQSLTIGQVGYPPTLLFFRNSLIGDMAFMLIFLAVNDFVRISSGLKRLPIISVSFISRQKAL